MRFRIVLLVSVLFMTMTSSVVFALESKQGGGDYHARVGELAYFEGKLETTGQEKGPYEVQFHAIRLEDEAEILSMKSSSTDGSYKFAMQFFDGAEHEVTIALVDPATKSVLAEKKITVEVEGFHPPFAVKAKTLAFLLLVIAFGMVLGVSVTRWGKANRKWKGEHPHVA
jgi:hypothetical protein